MFLLLLVRRPIAFYMYLVLDLLVQMGHRVQEYCCMGSTEGTSESKGREGAAASGREREVSSEYCVSCWNVHSKVGLFIANPGIHINCFRSLPREPVACRLLQHPWI